MPQDKRTRVGKIDRTRARKQCMPPRMGATHAAAHRNKGVENRQGANMEETIRNSCHLAWKQLMPQGPRTRAWIIDRARAWKQLMPPRMEATHAARHRNKGVENRQGASMETTPANSHGSNACRRHHNKGVKNRQGRCTHACKLAASTLHTGRTLAFQPPLKFVEPAVLKSKFPEPVNVQQPRLTPLCSGHSCAEPKLAPWIAAAWRQSATLEMMFAHVPPAGASITVKA